MITQVFFITLQAAGNLLILACDNGETNLVLNHLFGFMIVVAKTQPELLRLIDSASFKNVSSMMLNQLVHSGVSSFSNRLFEIAQVYCKILTHCKTEIRLSLKAEGLE